ncbi:MAG: hypothetical protein IKR36_00625 [Clostridia bacterium]|nr:hypothetical protein [Clostridia bacterium]
MEKRIQISIKLYEMMVDYIQNHFDPSDQQRFMEIYRGIEAKREADLRHNLYSAYKAEMDPTAREMLRSSYLDKAGIPPHGRWNEETERKFREDNFNF